MKRWRREPIEIGLRAACQGLRGWEYRENGVMLAKVAPIFEGFDKYTAHGWYWYGGGYNSLAAGVKFPDERAAMLAAQSAVGRKLSMPSPNTTVEG